MGFTQFLSHSVESVDRRQGSVSEGTTFVCFHYARRYLVPIIRPEHDEGVWCKVGSTSSGSTPFSMRHDAHVRHTRRQPAARPLTGSLPISSRRLGIVMPTPSTGVLACRDMLDAEILKENGVPKKTPASRRTLGKLGVAINHPTAWYLPGACVYQKAMFARYSRVVH